MVLAWFGIMPFKSLVVLAGFTLFVTNLAVIITPARCFGTNPQWIAIKNTENTERPEHTEHTENLENAETKEAIRIADPLGRPGHLDFLTGLPEDWSTWADRVFNRRQLPMLLGLTALTAVLVVTDRESWQEFRRLDKKNPFVHQMNRYAEFAGKGVSQFALAGAFAVGGFVANDNKSLRTASQIIEAILATGAVVQLGKHITGRESPVQTTSWTGDWDLFPDQVKYSRNVQAHDAVPSGHIATAQTTLTVIQENYPDQKWISYVGYPIIAWISVGLVGTSIHWWSDIPLGIAIGYSIGKVVTRNNLMKPNHMSRSQFFPEIRPILNSDGTWMLGFKWAI